MPIWLDYRYRRHSTATCHAATDSANAPTTCSWATTPRPSSRSVQAIGNPPQPLRHTGPPVPTPDHLVAESSAVGHIAAAKQLDPTFTNTAGNAKTLKPSMFISKRLLGKKNDMDDLLFPLYVHGITGLILNALQDQNTVAAAACRHAREVAEDAAARPWSAVLEWTNTVFERMEKGEISWANYDEIQRDRMRISLVSSVPEKLNIPCLAYNYKTCKHADSHDELGICLRHICGYCLYNMGSYNTHPVRICHSQGPPPRSPRPQMSQYNRNREFPKNWLRPLPPQQGLTGPSPQPLNHIITMGMPPILPRSMTDLSGPRRPLPCPTRTTRGELMAHIPSMTSKIWASTSTTPSTYRRKVTTILRSLILVINIQLCCQLLGKLTGQTHWPFVSNIQAWMTYIQPWKWQECLTHRSSSADAISPELTSVATNSNRAPRWRASDSWSNIWFQPSVLGP